MPLYEYRCPDCQKEEELLQPFDGKAPQCRSCKKEMVKKISRTGFSLKGEGWYKDHYGLKKQSQKSTPSESEKKE